MQTVLLVALLLSPLQAPATVQTAAQAEPPATSEAIALDPLEGAVFVHHCNVAYTQCPGGTRISCVGHTSCTSGAGWVKCDGVQTNCPPPPCFKVCMDGYTSCYSDTGNCSGSGVDTISCDGQQYQCGPPIG